MAEVTPGRPRISAVMATRDGASYLRAQLASIYEQRRRVDELVVTDDGSTDDTLEIVEEMHAQFGSGVDLVLLHEDEPLGVRGNFSRGLRAATGDLIMLSDQDDVWHPRRSLAAEAAFGSESGVLVVHTDARLVDADGAPLGLSLLDALEVPSDVRADLASGDALPHFLRRNLATGATMTVAAALVREALPVPESWVHDEWLAMLGAARGGLRLLSEELIDYRQHGENQIGVRAPTLRHKIRRVLEPRGERNARLVARADALVKRLLELGAGDAVVAAALEKARHERFRASLPSRRLARVRPVVREWRRGGYRRNASRGDMDVLRDLLQEATA